MLSRAPEAAHVLQSDREWLVMGDAYAKDAKMQVRRVNPVVSLPILTKRHAF
jgi:Tfp pilus assembly protein PilF